MTHDFRRKRRALFSPKVLVICFAPEAAMRWNDPYDLAEEYIAKVREVSRGQVVYRLEREVNVFDFPPLEGGQKYTGESWKAAILNDGLALRNDAGGYLTADYENILSSYMAEISEGKADEVWLFGGPLFGFYESRCIGREAYWLNAPPLGMECRRFAVMGFNYERGVREMCHDLGHRVESTMRHYGTAGWDEWLKENGDVHHAPGSSEAYSNDEFRWLGALRDEWWRLIAGL